MVQKILLGYVKGPKGDKGDSGHLTEEDRIVLEEEITQEVINRLKNIFGVNYVSFGDSIAAGHAINYAWYTDYGVDSQYGRNNNRSTVIVPLCYTDLISKDLVDIYTEDFTSVVSYAKSGDRVDDLMDKLTHSGVRESLEKAKIVTICIGANDVLEPALSNIEDYINTGNLDDIAAIVEQNLLVLNDDAAPTSYMALLNRLKEINPKAKYVFTTVYNPYKYLYLEDGKDGFFKDALDSIPQLTILGFEVDEYIKDELLDAPAVRKLFERVNGVGAWAENYVTRLNEIIKNKVNGFNKNFMLIDTKAKFDTFPDRIEQGDKHYNDLVNVQFTRGYDTYQMHWSNLWNRGTDSERDAFWRNLALKYVSLSGFDTDGFANELTELIVEKVIVPEIDPHPAVYGHYVMKCLFADVLDL